MVHMEETHLPGVGVRHDFESLSGKRVGVLTHRDGRRELYVSGSDHGPTPEGTATITLDPDEAAKVADLLGNVTISRQPSALVQDVEGLAVNWLPVKPGSPFVGRALAETRMRTRTGASVVAVMRADRAVAAPEPDFVLKAQDVAVLIGTPEGIAAATELLERGSSS